MATQLKEVIYVAEAVVEGGRGGHGRTSDGRLTVDLSVPESMGGGSVRAAVNERVIVERLWSQAGATGGNRSQIGYRQQRRK